MCPKPLPPNPPDGSTKPSGASAARIRKADAEQAFGLARAALGEGAPGVRLVDDGNRAEFALLGVAYATCERSGQGVVVAFLVDEDDRASLPADAGYEPDPARPGWFRLRLGKDPRRWRSAGVEGLVGRTLDALRRLAEVGRWSSLAASGAPFVVVPRSQRAHWSAEDAAAALAASGPATVLERPWGSALVMQGLAPVYLHFLADGALFVRATTRATAEEARLRELVAEIPERAFAPGSTSLLVEEPLVVFDGGATRGASPDPRSFACELAPGRYRVATGRYDAGGGLVLAVVRLTRDGAR